jgi:DNA (cytosine-5)-methyltransferase 1
LLEKMVGINGEIVLLLKKRLEENLNQQKSSTISTEVNQMIELKTCISALQEVNIILFILKQWKLSNNLWNKINSPSKKENTYYVKTFNIIINQLTELGYDLQWQVLNSKDFGVPQNRERVLIVGHLRGTPRPEVFPLAGQGNEHTTLGKSAETAVARTLTGGGHTGGNHSGMTILRVPEATKKGYAEAREGQSINLSVMGSKTRRGRVSNVAQTLDTGMQQYTIAKTVRSGGRGSPHESKQNWDSYEVEGRIRRLTPIECERLQGFEDGWTEGLSDSQRYKCLGNAVTTNVIEAVISRITTNHL